MSHGKEHSCRAWEGFRGCCYNSQPIATPSMLPKAGLCIFPTTKTSGYHSNHPLHPELTHSHHHQHCSRSVLAKYNCADPNSYIRHPPGSSKRRTPATIEFLLLRLISLFIIFHCKFYLSETQLI